MALLHHLLSVGIILTLINKCSSELFDVTTIYRIEKPHEVENFPIAPVALPDLWNWTSSGWIETDSVRAFAVLPSEERRALWTGWPSGLTESVPVTWDRPFVVTLLDKETHDQYYIIFMTSRNIHFGDLVVVEITGNVLRVLSCNFLDGGRPYAILNGRRCRDIGLKSAEDSVEAKHYYFLRRRYVGIPIASFSSEVSNGVLVNIHSKYLKDKNYLSIGVRSKSNMEFAFRIPKTLLALSESSGRLETYFSIRRPAVVCLEMTYLMQNYSGSRIDLFLDNGHRKITLGVVNGEENKGEWSTHRFLTERLQSDVSYRLVVEAHNKFGRSPIFIHSLQTCAENGSWNASTYPLPGRGEVHAMSNALGRAFRLHNGSVTGPVVRERTYYPSPDSKYDWKLERWHTYNPSTKRDQIALSSPKGYTGERIWMSQGSRYTDFMVYKGYMNISFRYPSNYNNPVLRIFITDSNSSSYENILHIKFTGSSLRILSGNLDVESYSERYYSSIFGKRTYYELCSNMRNENWKDGEKLNIVVDVGKSYVSSTSDRSRTTSCRWDPYPFKEGSTLYYSLHAENFQETEFKITQQEHYVVELDSQDGRMVSPPLSPSNNQLCLAMAYYMEPNTTLSISAERDDGKIFKMKTITTEKATGWQQKTFKKKYGIFDNALPVRFVVRGTRADNSRLVVQELSACDMNEDILELRQQDMLTVINSGVDVVHELPGSVTGSRDYCLNGGVLTSGRECACPSGFTGAACEQGCGPNSYGDDCSGRCSASREECRAMILCRPHLGCDCAPGYTGYFCTQNCSEYQFGAGCRQQCGHCRRGPCDPYTGQCSNGCTSGYHPPLCQEKCSYLVSPPHVERSRTGVTVTVNLSEGNVVGRGSPYYYQLQYKLAQGQWIPMRSDLIDSLQPIVTLNINSLPVYEVYWVRAVIINDDGTSYQGDSVPATEVHPECLVPGPADYHLRSDLVQADSFLLIWKDPPKTADWCQVSHYEVFIKEEWRWSLYCETNDSSVYIRERSPGEKYVVRVRAVTTSGIVANLSVPLEVKVAGWPLEEVRNLKVVSAESKTLTVSWDYPRPEADGVQHYVVSYECLEHISCPSQSCNNTRGVRQTEDFSITLHGLVPHSQYSVEVAPFKDVLGPSTGLLAITLPAGSQVEPGMVEEFVFGRTNSSFSVRWAAPNDCSGLNGFFRGYHYRLRPRGGQQVLAEGDTVQTTASFTRLDPHSHYDVEVFVVTNGGWDEKHPLSISASTTATTPEKVTQLTVYKAARRMLGLRWGAPHRMYGNLRSFTITQHETSNPLKAISVRLEPTPCRAWPQLYCFTIPHLKLDTQYTLKVRARNTEMDEDGEAEVIQATPHEGAPTAPSYITVTSRSNSSLSLRWGIPNMLNGILRSFLVSVEEVDTYDAGDCCQNFPIQELPVRAEESSYDLEVSGLRPASTYTVSVSGKTVALGPAVNITANTKPPTPQLSAAPSVTLDEGAEEVKVQLAPVTELQELVKKYLLLLIPILAGDQEVPEPVIWDDEFAEELKASVNKSFYLVAELSQEELADNNPVILQWGVSSDEGIFGRIIAPEPSAGVTYYVGEVAVLEYEGGLSFTYRESEPFTVSWL